ncbi:MAG: type I addiction module toxin, SymE family [Draconibacterium sp.]|nr:type I addiction module toxin, SymE family [Draconibacterium sp.]
MPKQISRAGVNKLTKVIKLQPHYIQKRELSKGYVIRPKLTMSGKWLEEAGFLPSTLINVEVQYGKLVITSKEPLL